MPLYEYICPACKRDFESIRPMNEGGRALACPTCGELAVRKPSRFSRGGGEALAGAGACAGCSSGSCGSCR